MVASGTALVLYIEIKLRTMKKKFVIGAAAAAVSGALAYLYKRSHSKKETVTPEAVRTRHRTDVFSKAKPHKNPVE